MTTTAVVPAFIRLPDVIALTGVPKSTIYFLAKKGDFPSPVKLSENSSAFRRAEIEAWIESRPTVYQH